MSKALRWRILTLQAVLVVVLGLTSGFMFAQASFVNQTIYDQLSSQKIYFPAADSAAIKALPVADAAAMKVYAGQELTTGAQAETYADHFIGVHLNKMAGGLTYAQVSEKAMANPKDAKMKGLQQTMFQGNSLRGMLLNAWGWSQVALYTGYAAWGLLLAAGVVLIALLFEAFIAPRRELATA